MDALNTFFDYIGHVDPGPQRDRSQALFLFAGLFAQRPGHVLKIGISSGYLTLTALYALRANGTGNLVCLDTGGGLADRRPLEAAGVRFVTGPVGDGIRRLADGRFDCVVGDTAACAGRIDDLVRITAARGMVVVHGMAAQEGALNAMAEQARGLGHGCRLLGGTDSGNGSTINGLALIVFPESKQANGHDGARRRCAFEQPKQPDEPLCLAMPPPADNFGWGLCSRYLEEELAKLTVVRRFDPGGTSGSQPHPGRVFHGLSGIDLDPLYPNCWGRYNVGYTFFENELTDRSVENARRFDMVLGGSTWCCDRMREKGIANCDVLIQGIDPSRFYPVTDPKDTDHFVIFSGGKFELRKGQDIVLAAVKVLQEKYPDIVLVNCWHNLWPPSMDTMAQSCLIRYERRGDTWAETMAHIYRINGLDPDRIFTIGLVPNATQRSLYAQTDIGVFPNRCEGGTNLVLMEYMACAKPVIASNTSGHCDIVTADNAILLNDFKPMTIKAPDGTLAARWQDPSVDELIAAIEWAYHHRDQAGAIGRRAGRDLSRLTWEQSARCLIGLIDAGARQTAVSVKGAGRGYDLRRRWGLTRQNVGTIDISGLAGHISDPEYRGYFLDRAFCEHYRLIAWLSTLFGGRLIFDIGTNRGCSALALAFSPANRVISYDIADSLRLDCKEALTTIEFHIGDVLADPRLCQAALVMLDTNHDGVFEGKVYRHLRQNGFGGLLFLDDIHLNAAMESFWAEIPEPKEDITDLGHWSGSGLVDFHKKCRGLD